MWAAQAHSSCHPLRHPLTCPHPGPLSYGGGSSGDQMTYVQALTGRGGWPMSVWLTPELQPIYGATYLPPVVGGAWGVAAVPWRLGGGGLGGRMQLAGVVGLGWRAWDLRVGVALAEVWVGNGGRRASGQPGRGVAGGRQAARQPAPTAPPLPHGRVHAQAQHKHGPPPAQDRPGMPSFATVLRRIANVWDTRRDDLVAQARLVAKGKRGGSGWGSDGTEWRRLPHRAAARLLLSTAPRLPPRTRAPPPCWRPPRACSPAARCLSACPYARRPARWSSCGHLPKRTGRRARRAAPQPEASP